MKNKIIMRTLLCLLALSMLVTCFVSCSKNDEDDQSKDTTVSTNTGDEIYDANGYLLDALPRDLDYGGVDINILGWNSEVTEYEVEELNGVPIDESIYKRNATIESRLNVNLVFDLTVKGSNNAKAEYAQHVERSIGSDAPYDIITAHTGSISTCSINGLLQDLGAIENSYLDFEKPWWNDDIIEISSVGGTFYFCTGDASTSFPQMIYCVYFNAGMVNDLKLTSPYELIENNEWTYETMIQMGMNVYNDNNDNGRVDTDDTIPMTGFYYDWPALLHGCDVKLVEKDASGAFVLTQEIKGEKSINIMKKLNDFVTLDRAFVAMEGNDLNATFMAGRSLFHVVQTGAATRWSFAGSNVDYGCVPVPKYDADQENYCSTVRQPISLFGLPRGGDSERQEMVTAVLECYGSEGYRQTTPVIFEQVMKYQDSGSEQMTEMLTLIRDTASFDIGRIYSKEVGSLCDMPGYYLRDQAPWENYINQSMSTIANKLADLSDTLISVAN